MVMKGRQCVICKKFDNEVGEVKLVRVPVVCVETQEENNKSEAIYKDLWLCKNCSLKLAVVNKKPARETVMA